MDTETTARDWARIFRELKAQKFVRQHRLLIGKGREKFSFLVLTKAGRRVLEKLRRQPSPQTFYARPVKPQEARTTQPSTACTKPKAQPDREATLRPDASFSTMNRRKSTVRSAKLAHCRRLSSQRPSRSLKVVEEDSAGPISESSMKRRKAILPKSTQDSRPNTIAVRTPSIQPRFGPGAGLEWGAFHKKSIRKGQCVWPVGRHKSASFLSPRRGSLPPLGKCCLAIRIP